jgi:DNA-binding NarL/FixJ family response regulator
MTILNYTREQVQQFVKDGICEVQAVRDWDIAFAKRNGEKNQNIAYDNKISRRQVHNILNKLQGKV